MKTRLITYLLASLFLIAGTTPSFSQSAEQRFQKGILKEEGEGNLTEAIDIFSSIVENSHADEALQAKALLHVGLCYEKLGKKEATKAYQKVINNFPTRKNEVAIARERLSRLILAEKKTDDVSPKPTFSKIKLPTNPGNGVLSPDGKKLAFIYDGCVWTIPVSGGVAQGIAGEPQKLTGNIAARDMSNSFAWSGDGKWIVVNAKTNGKESPDMPIYLVPSEGGNPREVEVPAHVCGWPQEFRLSLSPDGKMLAYTTGHQPGDWQNKYTHVYTIPVKGGEAKELTEEGTQEPAFSPDGRMIAYVKCNKSPNASYYYSNVWVVPSKGGTPVKVSNFQSGQASGPVWSPDGRMIAFLRRPEGENPKELWIVPVTDEGNPSATAKKIDLPLESFYTIAGWTPDNKIGVQLMNPQSEIIYTVPASGGIATQVTPRGWNSYPKWSPDGEKIFFRGDRGMIAYVPAEGGAIDSIPIQSEFQMHTAVPGSGNELSPDGKTIVFSGGRYFLENGVKKWDVNLYTLPVEGGKPRQITEVAAELQDRFPCWSPDGNSIAFIRPEIINGSHIMHIFTVSKDGDDLNQISTDADHILWAPVDWSPDGKYITFFTKSNSIRSIPSQGGKSVLVTKVDSVNNQFDLAWSPDGKELAYTDQGRLWIYSPETATTREVKTGVKASVTKIGWSPNGEKIAFTAYSGGDNELYMVENFLPLEKLNSVVNKEKISPKFTKINIPTKLSWSVALSPDGKELALVSDKKLWKMPLSGNLGPNIPGVPVQLNTGEVEVEWTGLSWSKDGKWIAFNDYPRRDKDGKSIKTQGIYKVSSVGGLPKKVIENFRSARVVNYHISLSPDGNEVAFSSIKNEEQHIFTMPTEGGEPKQLTEMKAREPIYSPDGKFIAFVEDKELGRSEGDLDLYVVSSVGGTPHKIADADKATSPVWSPDGSMIAYLDATKGKQIFIAPVTKQNNTIQKSFSVEAPEGTEEVRLLAGWTPDNKIGALMVKKQEFGLYTLPAEGGQAARILHDTYALQPRWSPDGKRIYYVTYPKDAINKFRKWYLAFVSANGGKGDAVFEESERKVGQLPFQSGNRVSPDGKILLSAAYSKNDTVDAAYSWPFTRIWKIALDGSKVEKLTNQTGSYADGSPCWSPDGEKVAFVRAELKKGDMDPYGDAAIYMIDASGGDSRLLVTETGKWVNSLTWSPNGKMLAWLSQEREAPQTKPKFLNIYDFELRETRIAGEVQTQHVNIETSWSPDSKHVAFNDKEGKVIKVMNIDDGSIEDINTGLVDTKIYHLDWSPDGKKFVFAGIKGGEKEFYFIENFLPLEKLAQDKKTKN